MLSPHERTGLSEALRPPIGYELQQAVGTSFTLDMEAALTVPLAFACYEAKEAQEDGQEPIALLDAVRRTAAKITIFAQVGYLAVPDEHRRIYTWLEDMIVPVEPPSGGGIFHPKLWAAQYVSLDSEDSVVRLVCATRNLTFDTSWDTVLVTDATPAPRSEESNATPVAHLIRALSGRVGSLRRRRAVEALADEIDGSWFPPPDPFGSLRFEWLPDVDLESLLPAAAERVVAVSPFLDLATVSKLRTMTPQLSLVSRPSTFDRLGADALGDVDELKVLNPAAEVIDERDTGEDRSTVEPAAAAKEDLATAPRHGNLHAKLVVADAGKRTTVITGSANATSAGWKGNDEVVAVLTGPVSAGVGAVLAEDASEGPGPRVSSLGSILVDHIYGGPVDQVGEELTWLLENARHQVAAMPLQAEVEQNGAEYDVHVTCPVADVRWPSGLPGARVSLRPLSLPPGQARAVGRRNPIDEHWQVELLDLTAFFVLTISVSEAGRSRPTSCLVKAELIGAPEQRSQKVLSSLIGDGPRLVAFLLALLGLDAPSLAVEAEPDDGPDQPPSEDKAARARTSGPVLERILRTVHDRPADLDIFGSLIADLGDGAREALGENLHDLWLVVDEVRTADR